MLRIAGGVRQGRDTAVSRPSSSLAVGLDLPLPNRRSSSWHESVTTRLLSTLLI